MPHQDEVLMHINKKLCARLPVITLVCAGLFASAQTGAHVHTPLVAIDGSQHPELIADSVAYRLYFTTVSLPPNPTSEQAQLQVLQLGMIGLNAGDTQAIVKTLAAFRVRLDSLVDDYNKSVNTAPDSETHFKVLVGQQDALVANTRKVLKAVLSADGMIVLDKYVKREKAKMSVAAGQTD
jgi:hypothetical protein